MAILKPLRAVIALGQQWHCVCGPERRHRRTTPRRLHRPGRLSIWQKSFMVSCAKAPALRTEVAYSAFSHRIRSPRLPKARLLQIRQGSSRRGPSSVQLGRSGALGKNASLPDGAASLGLKQRRKDALLRSGGPLRGAGWLRKSERLQRLQCERKSGRLTKRGSACCALKCHSPLKSFPN
jgi:hypothetical protein